MTPALELLMEAALRTYWRDQGESLSTFSTSFIAHCWYGLPCHSSFCARAGPAANNSVAASASADGSIVQCDFMEITSPMKYVVELICGLGADGGPRRQ